jgi:hypothetical protein
MLRPQPLAHLRQQLLPKCFLALLRPAPRSHAGRCDGASKYAGQLLQAKRFIGWSTGSIPRLRDRAGLRWT